MLSMDLRGLPSDGSSIIAYFRADAPKCRRRRTSLGLEGQTVSQTQKGPPKRAFPAASGGRRSLVSAQAGTAGTAGRVRRGFGSRRRGRRRSFRITAGRRNGVAAERRAAAVVPGGRRCEGSVGRPLPAGGEGERHRESRDEAIPPRHAILQLLQGFLAPPESKGHAVTPPGSALHEFSANSYRVATASDTLGLAPGPAKTSRPPSPTESRSGRGAGTTLPTLRGSGGSAPIRPMRLPW